jgi:hypothetical protein
MAVNEGKNTLSRRQQQALLALVEQPSLKRAAAQAGVGERSLQRWMSEDAAFRAEYQKLKKELMGNAILRLQKSAADAVECLTDVMHDVVDSPASARVAAAREILQQALRVMEAEMLEQRILELEQKVEELGVKSRANGKGAGYPLRG